MIAGLRTAILSAVAGISVTETASAAGMPQFQFGNPLMSGQVFWLAVIFLLLYLILSRSALPQVASVLAERRTRIEGDLDAASTARGASERAIEELRKTRREAAAEAAGIVEKVVAEARDRAAIAAREANARLEAEIARAEAGVSSARQQALGSLRSVATDTAGLLIDRLTGTAIDPALVERTVDGLLAARPA